MAKEIVCIVCPNGCRLTAEQTETGIKVSGNECPRGEKFAAAELTAPMRTITGTVATAFKDFPLLPVKSAGELPKDKLMAAARVLGEIKVKERLRVGETVLEDFFGTSLTASADMTEHFKKEKITAEDDNG